MTKKQGVKFSRFQTPWGEGRGKGNGHDLSGAAGEDTVVSGLGPVSSRVSRYWWMSAKRLRMEGRPHITHWEMQAMSGGGGVGR